MCCSGLCCCNVSKVTSKRARVSANSFIRISCCSSNRPCLSYSERSRSPSCCLDLSKSALNAAMASSIWVEDSSRSFNICCCASFKLCTLWSNLPRSACWLQGDCGNISKDFSKASVRAAVSSRHLAISSYFMLKSKMTPSIR